MTLCIYQLDICSNLFKPSYSIWGTFGVKQNLSDGRVCALGMEKKFIILIVIVFCRFQKFHSYIYCIIYMFSWFLDNSILIETPLKFICLDSIFKFCYFLFVRLDFGTVYTYISISTNMVFALFLLMWKVQFAGFSIFYHFYSVYFLDINVNNCT